MIERQFQPNQSPADAGEYKMRDKRPVNTTNGTHTYVGKQLTNDRRTGIPSQ